MSLPRLRIKKREQQRLRDGHLWVYSNEIDTEHTPLKNINGSLVHLEDYRGNAFATASFCSKSLICARLLSHSLFDTLTVDFFKTRIEQALKLREQIYTLPYYRLVYAEGDFLAGLIIDRYNHTFVVQIATQAFEDAIELIMTALHQLFGSDISIVLKQDGKGRSMEQLPLYSKTVGPEVSALEIIENNVHFKAPLDGQKTGWFYDHRAGRNWLNACAKGKTVLDVFSYIGGWGIQAAVHGATAVTCVDISEVAGKAVLENAILNQCKHVQFIQSDAFDYLKKPITEQFDVVVLDPPALIQKRKDFDAGRQAYFILNENAIGRVNNGGLFITASCSLHLSRSELLSIVQQVARRQKKHVQLIAETHPDADHPRLLAMMEGEYLKCLMFRVQDVNI